MQAASVKPWSSQDGAAADPWRCLRACDKENSCRGVFITKPNSTWTCWFVRGSFGLGSTASSLKAVPSAINAYLWTWSGNSSQTTGVRMLQMSHSLLLATVSLFRLLYDTAVSPAWRSMHVTVFMMLIGFLFTCKLDLAVAQ